MQAGPLHAWESLFARSGHPLGGALHGLVDLAELQARSREADYLYSTSTFALLDAAKPLAETRTLPTAGGTTQPVLRLADVAAALVLRVHPGLAESSPTAHAIEEVLSRALKRWPPAPELQLHRQTAPAEAAEGSWVLAPDLVDTLALAAHLAMHTPGRRGGSVDLETFVLAMLLLPDSRGIFFRTLLGPDADMVASEQRDVVLDVLKQSVSFVAVWDGVVGEIGVGTVEPPLVPPRRVPDYVADRPVERLRDDVLDFRADARAVAEIVCQREPGPPLAIGLFGNWGSGKSSFMHLLRHEIDQLAAQARAAGGASPFVTRADHIFFNAWQYNDAQLWPVLAEFTFAQLRAGGAEALSNRLADEVYEELTGQVRRWEDTAEGLALDLMSAQHAETELRDAVLTAADTRDETLKAARDAAVDAIAGLLAGSARRERLTAEAVVDTLPEGPAMPAGPVADALRAIRLAWSLRLAPHLLLAGIGLAVASLGLATVAREALLGVAASALPILAWLANSVAPLLRAIAGYRREQAAALQRFRSTEREALLQLARLRREIEKTENEIRRQLSRVAQFKGRSPAQVLEYFLSESAAVQALQGEVGVVSRVRRAFAQLNAVVRRHEATPDAPQRLVFYIDDLDRCRAEQVVRVLEAVHLLLAFDRFVVVVGVDTRWLETSLMSYYDEQLRSNRGAGLGRDGATPDPRATVRDYVEKIFQVPVQIPHLTSGPDGTFARLVDRLSPTQPAAAAAPAAAPEPGAQQRPVAPIEPLDLVLAEPERFAEAVARAMLTAEEVAMLRQLGPLAGRSPRAVKRLLNLYRLLRATRVGGRLTGLLQGDATTGNFPDYPGVQLCLAVEVGRPAEQIDRFRDAVLLAADAGGVRPSDVLALPVAAGQQWTSAMHGFVAGLAPTREVRELEALFAAVVERFGDAPERLTALRDIVVETARFSFSPMADHPVQPAPAAPEAKQPQRKPSPRQQRRPAL